MSGYYFIYTTYEGGRVSIRDHPYHTLSEARRAQKLKQKRLADDPTVKSVKIGEQFGINLNNIDLKKLI